MRSAWSILYSLSYLFPKVIATQSACRADNFDTPQHFGTKVLRIEASEVHNAAPFHEMNLVLNLPDYRRRSIDFCNVTVTYTHPGVGDEINVWIWLPLDGWNGRFMGVGGGGFVTGLEVMLAAPVELGYAAASTDGGHRDNGPDAGSAARWALKSPGNVDLYLLQDFASTSLNDMTAIAKSITESYYGEAPKYSYWNGCSTGGRQGLMQAQRYPQNYDGILAAAPAIHFADLAVVTYWGQFLMNKENYYPPSCELEAVRQAAIHSCDDLDGVRDGIISAPGHCKWDANEAVGLKCCGGTRKVTKAAARIATAMYKGLEKARKPASLGSNQGIPFTGLLNTQCDENEENCGPAPFSVVHEWIRYFVVKDAEFDPATVRDDNQIYRFLHRSKQEYESIIGTTDSDLSEFKAAGGRMITWHGLSDQLINPNYTAHYYERVLKADPSARDYYRYFEVPGVEHCFGGPGAYPSQVWQSLVDWVEKGNAPDILDAYSPDYDRTGDQGFSRKICQWPQVAQYIGGDVRSAASYRCADDFGVKQAVIKADL